MIIFQIPCSMTLFNSTQFKISKRDIIVINKFSDKKDIKNDIRDNFSEKESDEELFDQDF